MVVLWAGSIGCQGVVNYRKKSTIGYSMDFSIVGFVGFGLLLFNQTVGIINPWTDAGRVNNSDMAFAVAAFIFSSISYTQCFMYPSTPTLKSTKILIVFVLISFIGAATLETKFNLPLQSYTGVSLLNLAAFFKAGSSLLKYLFQIYENWKNKSVEGVSKLAF